MPCLWLHKVFCSVGHLLSKIFHCENSFLKLPWVLSSGSKMVLQNKTLSGLRPEQEWIKHDLTLTKIWHEQNFQDI